jgi:hypothetical protein
MSPKSPDLLALQTFEVEWHVPKIPVPKIPKSPKSHAQTSDKATHRACGEHRHRGLAKAGSTRPTALPLYTSLRPFSVEKALRR